jgi:hypothetical protein
MQKEEKCRHCGEHFIPRTGKPGFIDECPECLTERIAPPPMAAARIKNWIETAEGKRWLKRFTRNFVRLGFSKEVAEDRARKLIRKAIDGT